MLGWSRISDAVRRLHEEPGHGLVVLARMRLRWRLLIFAAAFAAFWVLGWQVGTVRPIPWRMSALVLYVSAIFLWGALIGLVCIAVNLVMVYFYLGAYGLPFQGGWFAALLALGVLFVAGLLRDHVLRLHDAYGEMAESQGMVAICSHCKRIRDLDGTWQQVDHYVEEHSAMEFTHSICPTCVEDEMRRFDRTG